MHDIELDWLVAPSPPDMAVQHSHFACIPECFHQLDRVLREFWDGKTARSRLVTELARDMADEIGRLSSRLCQMPRPQRWY
jgi:hypothetical protein